MAPGKQFQRVYPGSPLTPSLVAGRLKFGGVRVLNVAGNRAGVAPDIGPRVERFLGAVLRRLGHRRV